MANTQLSVKEFDTADEASISRASRRSSLEVSRAQMASSDGHRGPRRPSMNFQTISRLPEVPTPTEHARRENGQAWTEERTVTRTDRDIRVSGHRQSRHHEYNHRRASGHGHAAQQPVLTPESLHVHNYHHYDNHDRHNHNHHHANTDVSRRREFRGVGSATTRDSYDDIDDQRFVVPALPMPIAVMCCILNFIFPGLGSMTAGVCVLCCGDTEGMTSGEKCGSCCTVFGIGLLQLLLVACFLVGWIWSCIWGITFIGMSASYYDNDDDDYYYQEQYHQQQARSNNPAYRGRNRHSQSSRLPTPQVVVDQPYPGVRYEDISREQRSRRTASRRTRSRISLTPSNLIYPMRAPSNITYNSPPPPYPHSPPPVYTTQSRNIHSVVEH